MVENTTEAEKVDVTHLFEHGVSTKGEGRALDSIMCNKSWIIIQSVQLALKVQTISFLKRLLLSNKNKSSKLNSDCYLVFLCFHDKKLPFATFH